MPGGNAALADTSCLNRDTIRTINEESVEIDRKFPDSSYNGNSNSSNAFSFVSQQGILVKSRQFRKQTEVNKRNANYFYDKDFVYLYC